MTVHPHEDTHPDSRPSNSPATMVSVGALSTAFLASVCCIGPVLLAAFGVGVGVTGVLAGTVGFLKELLPYRPFFIGLTLLLLGWSFYMTYRNSSSLCGNELGCTVRTVQGSSRKWLWLMAVLAVVLILAPYWLVV